MYVKVNLNKKQKCDEAFNSGDLPIISTPTVKNQPVNIWLAFSWVALSTIWFCYQQ